MQRVERAQVLEVVLQSPGRDGGVAVRVRACGVRACGVRGVCVCACLEGGEAG